MIGLSGNTENDLMILWICQNTLLKNLAILNI